ncbi:TRAP transporter small permease [Oceanidesulfovibrio marinus]|uniref:TRAP transporter small permease n=1 Tax=Oceanidesulfovibrio marinus TaxID=370038 RepID=A0A6P1ZH88_9BACT|nr:TRAP transporter small permease [Oceanidesulfovibrio marinus]QJT07566.1 TRAP transporter small permease [Oceanidesulfovibrio marinus]TVM34519.1 hypothetical protein DQK91_08065 [Oceanidesulfovibrio marinus]
MRRTDLLKIFDVVSATLLGAIMILTVAAVFQRYIMSSPIQWAEEVNGILFLWSIMLGCASAKRTNSHLTINILSSHLSGRARSILQIFLELMTIAVMALLSWYGAQLALQVKFKITNVLGFSFAYYDYAIPVGAAGVALFSIMNIYSIMKHGDIENKELAQ